MEGGKQLVSSGGKSKGVKNMENIQGILLLLAYCGVSLLHR